MSILSLTLIGAGCAKSDDKMVAIPSSQANSETLIGASGTNLSGAAALKREVETDNAAQAAAAAAPVAKAEAMEDKAPAAKRTPRPTAFPGILPSAEVDSKIVRIMTTKGEIVFELLPKDGPKAASNFVALANSGFYDGLTFHRVVPGFVIQGGDPSGNGTGGPGYQFEDDKVTKNYDAGIVAMANSGPNTNGSQFFIMLDDAPTLPKAYSVFGRVLSGMEVVRAIAVGDKMTKVSIEDRK